jgi:hypothetical protein
MLANSSHIGDVEWLFSSQEVDDDGRDLYRMYYLVHHKVRGMLVVFSGIQMGHVRRGYVIIHENALSSSLEMCCSTFLAMSVVLLNAYGYEVVIQF